MRPSLVVHWNILKSLFPEFHDLFWIRCRPANKLVVTAPGFDNPVDSILQRLKDEHRFLVTRERPAVTEVVAWAASNGDRSENADYQYGKRGCARSTGGFAFSRSESNPRK
jgi:hypothetical protein